MAKKKKINSEINNADIEKLKEYAEEKTKIIELKEIEEELSKNNSETSDNKTEYYNLLENDKNHTLLKLLSIIVIVIVGIFLVHKLVISDSKFIFTTNLNKIYEKLANNIVKVSNSELFSNKYQLNSVLQIDTDDKNYEEYTNYHYNFKFDLDKENKNYSFNININDLNNSKILDTTYLISNDNHYIKLDSIYNDTIKVNSNLINFDARINDLLRNYDLSKLNNSVKLIKNIINKHIDKQYLSQEKNNNNTSIVLTLSKEQYSTVLSKIIDEIKDNNNIINNLASTLRLNNNDIIKNLDKLLQDNLNNNFNTIKIKINTTGLLHQTESYQILLDDKEVFNINVNDMTFKYNYNNYNISFYKEDKYKATINDNIKLTFNELSYDTIDIDYTYNDNYGNIHFNKYNKDENKSGKISYSYVTKDNKNSMNIDYRFENYSPIVIGNPLNYEEISDEDYVSITNKINDTVKIKSIANYLNDTINKLKEN